MNKYIIMTDSSCDLPQWKLDEIGVGNVLLTVDLDGKNYVNYPDWREIAPHAFYDELRTGKPAKTSAANVERFKEVMRPHLEAGCDILYVGFSTGLSGTFNAGRIAGEELLSEYPDRKIIAVDSLCASLGQGMLVDMAAEQRAKGATIEENARFCEENRLRICHWFTVDDLFYLHRGGRVSKTTAIVGSALGMKPVMYMDDEGRLTKAEVARGRKNSIRRLVDKMRENYRSLERVYIVHGDCPDDAKLLESMVEKEFGINNIVTNYVGPVIGTHSGPGTLALFFIADKRI